MAGRLFACLTLVTAIALCATPAPANVTIDGLTYSFLGVSVRSTVGEGIMADRAAGEYIVVKISIRNVGNQPADVTDSDFHLRRGTATFDSAAASMDMPNPLFLVKLNPGVTRVGYIVFDVPAHTSPSKYELLLYGNGTDNYRAIQL